ncbi:hypothetical protein H0H87_012685 [Tephrocybe sp. NHM501043]|nr:hypothetical protein H0H87_012685 [Tephrocybe sp. NHM501043]
MREAIKSALRFLSAPVWKDYVIGPTGGLENATTDQLLDDYIHKNTFTSSHTVGTAAMSPKNANYGVVDPDLRVKRVSGLRVVDASIMVSRAPLSTPPTDDLYEQPFVTCGHTQAPTYIIAERAADLIKETWNLQSSSPANTYEDQSILS